MIYMFSNELVCQVIDLLNVDINQEITIDELTKEIEKFSALSEADIRAVIIALENLIHLFHNQRHHIYLQYLDYEQNDASLGPIPQLSERLFQSIILCKTDGCRRI